MRPLRKIFVDILSEVSDLNKPSNNSSEKLKQELRLRVKNFEYPKVSNEFESEASWQEYLNQLKYQILNKDPGKFLQWDVIKSSMFCALFPQELEYLQARQDWNNRWKQAIVESKFGKPDYCREYPQSSSNLIHHAYHLAQFEEKVNVKVEDLSTVFEFGGGYGSMCRLFYNLGFKGKYIILDLPFFSMLQEYYLKSIGLLSDNPESNKNSIICTSDYEKLPTLFSENLSSTKNLFLATWSFSETPVENRESFLPHFDNFDHFLFAYQDRYKEADNIEYFRKFRELFCEVNWLEINIPHLPINNYYLFGKSNN